MNSEVIANKIGEQEWLEPIETGLQKGVEGVFSAGGAVGKKAEDALDATKDQVSAASKSGQDAIRQSSTH